MPFPVANGERDRELLLTDRSTNGEERQGENNEIEMEINLEGRAWDRKSCRWWL